jgi:hypothetical protein
VCCVLQEQEEVNSVLVSWLWGPSVCWGLFQDLPHKAQLRGIKV